MNIRTVYTNGAFDVFDGDRHLIHQPFKPTAEGTQEPFADEAEALAWWDTQKAGYGITNEE